MHILSIESSCDETSIAVVTDGVAVRSNIIASSQSAFLASGGVIPEEAARKQLESMLPVLHQALAQAALTWKDIDAIAVTKGPGLLGSLLVGTVTARALSALHHKPLIPIHHTLGHLSSTWLDLETHNSETIDLPQFPLLTLSASGGHTELWLRTSHLQGVLLGRTRDDAAGEAFDKGATLLGLPYPGGPSIAKAAQAGNATAYEFPLPLKNEHSFDCSFSGLKTALRYTIRDLSSHPQDSSFKIQNSVLSDLAASYQAAICRHLVDRMRAALLQHPEVKEVHIVGGVSANTVLRTMTSELCAGRCVVRFPKKLSYCTDNAAMIASAGYFAYQAQPSITQTAFETEASLPLTEAVMEIRK